MPLQRALLNHHGGLGLSKPMFAQPRLSAARCRASPAADRAAPTPQNIFSYKQLELETNKPIQVLDITGPIKEEIARTGLREGVAHVISRHTTTAVTINENEERLFTDLQQFLTRLAPPGAAYHHNELHLRPAPEGWPGGWEAWAKQEPENAHSHLMAMVLGGSEAVPVSAGQLCTGTWQSILLVELDGPRKRTVGFQLVGTT